MAARKTRLQLGRDVAIPESPDKAVLDAVSNPHADTDYVVRFTAPEFTTLCPITGQPDFAHFVIDYAPGRQLLESKSLKLFLASFRNMAAFHEDCTVNIGKRWSQQSSPSTCGSPVSGIRVAASRSTSSADWPLPKDVWLPDIEVEPYRGASARARCTPCGGGTSRGGR
jgi:7-cyano-7-deazaguanine reductase